jgi:hypothetical protein
MFPSYRRMMLLLSTLVAIPGPFQALAGDEPWQFDPFWTGPRKPMVDFSYGLSSPRHKLFQGDLDKAGAVEVKLGFFKARPETAYVAFLSDKYTFFNYASSDLFGRTLSPVKVKSEIIRFGFGDRKGYAYDFTSSYLYPYTQTSMQWTKLKTGRPAGLSDNDAAILAFGIGQVVSIHAGYEVMGIYPRFVFWPWLGSYGIASIGMGAVSHFGKEVVEASPVVGPVLYSLLRGGVAYGYYMLVRDDQFWPFKSETPLTSDGFKLGVTLTF